ncbi:MAG TPA: amidohydrolase [Chloroflexi bacterium]|nr:amidohydrolase [Chloroflexota bacterium]
MHADLIFTRGIVHTLDPRRPRAEAVAVAGDRILDTGSSTEMLAYRGPQTRVVELGGRALLPGFYDAHQHQLYMGLGYRQVNARVPSIREILNQVRARAERQPPGSWIEGAGYDDNKLAERRHLTRHDLDAVAPDHPTFITRTCGHVMALNSAALAAAGIGRETPDPPGGSIDRDLDSGEPTGVVRESAMEWVRRVVPLPSLDQLKLAILEAADVNLRLGITSVWEPSVEPDHVRAYRDLEADGRLPLRVTMAHKKVLRSGEVVPLPQPFSGPWLKLVAVKLFQDGGIGPRTAALTAPYEGEPDNRGLLRWSQAELDAIVHEIHHAGLRVSIHAIGDAAIASALDAIEAALAAQPRADHRHRLEHCGLPLPALQPRLVELGVIPVLQPPFLYFDGGTYVRNLGAKRSRWLYPARTLLHLGLTVAGSSDAPVVRNHSPLLGIRTAMTRVSFDGVSVAPEERVTLDEALQLYTRGAAVAGGEETEKGTITAGKLADLVVLGADPAALPIEELADIPVEMVVVGGEIRITELPGSSGG